MMSPTMWADVPFKNSTAFHDWAGVHALWHQAVAETLALAGKPYRTFPLGSGVGTQEWMRVHAQEHQYANQALGIEGPPNLTDYKWSDQDDWSNFHFIHANASNILRVAAGIA